MKAVPLGSQNILEFTVFLPFSQHSLIYQLLKEQQPYRELGPDHVDEKAAEVARRRALRTLEQLGYDVTLQSTEVA